MSLALDRTEDLAARWRHLRAEAPRLRIRDAALHLGASEAALVATIPGVGRLRPDWAALLHGLTHAGPVMALTRNAACVHERHGTYRDASVHGQMGLVVGEEIDLRLFLAQWKHAFFVPAAAPGSPRGSLQFFDASGEAVHKVFATEATPDGSLARLAASLADMQAPPLATTQRQARAEPNPDATIDAGALREAWRGLRDTHDFFPMLRRFKVGRQQAFRLAGMEFAQPLEPAAIARALTLAAGQALPIMVFVGNPGCIQIHTGTITRLVQMEEWFNVLDPEFNLHLRTPAIASAWLIRKPTADGIVTSIEAFDAAGEVIVMLFGKRKPGQVEDPAWRMLAEGIAA